MKKVLTFLMAIAMGLGATVCSSPSTSSGSSSNQGGEILTGCLRDVTGPTSSLGQMVQASAQWAVDEINENGGIDGRKIKMSSYDTKGDVTETMNAFTKAITVDRVSVIAGPPVANIALTVKGTSEQYDVPVMGLAMDKNIQLKQDDTPYKNMFTFQPNADQQGAVMVKHAIEDGFKSFGAIYNKSNSYSTSLLAPFVQTVESSGGTTPKNLQVAYNANDTDFKALLSLIVKANVDAIFVPNYTKDLVNITTAACTLGYKGVLICGLDACPPFNTMMSTSCDGVYYISNINDTAQTLQDMIRTVKEKTGVEATNRFFLGYDIVNIAAKVLKENGTSDPVKTHTALENVTDYSGMTGSISIDPKTHMTESMEILMFAYKGTTPKFLQKFAA